MSVFTRRSAVLASVGVASALVLAGCSGGATTDDGSSSSAAGGDAIGVTLITKDPNDPFWVAMIDGAEQAAKDAGVEITVASGRDQTDSDSQIQAIENAIQRGDSGILIANNGPAVNDAIQKAEDAGLIVIALDTPTTPIDLVDATFASDNRLAGQLIGEWAAAKLGGDDATIALIDLFSDKVVSVDYERDQGFLAGMGIDVADENMNGDEAATGSYSQGSYEIVCNEASNGAEDGGRTAMEKCLSLNPDINVVYTANEPSALGAVQALKAAGNDSALVVTINGSCDGIAGVADGSFGADAQQYPSKMGSLGVQAVIDYVNNGTKPTADAGKDFTNTGITLVTDQPVDGVDSIDSTAGADGCY
ncbi:substrate-binding domain-containing protein [Actinotalea sp. M2MS4P-6]|uniref:substrate-binding domain-containing protein n=1 Tax=Actinotalea sp. M2MS4P-6 TaxID=2983762 RepID=UPI0021E39F64|nr:substrate-binding domain-containing protein [Actinotalea sp. M2MS4P-6]MCV2393252.1 substrate-binding domain-containing protein [Actinotalea sp. M2MS4P-6]